MNNNTDLNKTGKFVRDAVQWEKIDFLKPLKYVL